MTDPARKTDPARSSDPACIADPVRWTDPGPARTTDPASKTNQTRPTRPSAKWGVYIYDQYDDMDPPGKGLHITSFYFALYFAYHAYCYWTHNWGCIFCHIYAIKYDTRYVIYAN